MSDKQGVPSLPPLPGGGGNNGSNNNGGQQSVSLQQVLATQGLNVITTGAGQQFVLTSQVPGFSQVLPSSTSSPGLQQMGVTRIVNISGTSPRVSVVGMASGSGTPLTSPSRQNSTKVVLATSPKLVRTSLRNMFLTPTSASPPVKKLKLSDSTEKSTHHDDSSGYRRRIMEHKMRRMRAIREKYAENTSELFFLNAGGNMMDFQTWKKRSNTPPYLHFLRQHRLDPEDDDEDLTQPLPSDALGPSVQGPEVKITGTGATPVAVSTTLPAAVAQLSQGGTPIVPTPLKSSPPVSSSPVTDKVSITPQKSPLNPSATPSSSQPVVKLVKLPSSTQSTCDSQSNQEQIVEKAKQEAYVMQRITELQREGLWSERRLPKVQEPARTKAHWDYLLEEMVWLAADFAQERKWKKAAAKKCARMVQKHFQEKAIQAQKAEKLQELRLKKIAGFVAKEIKTFWANVEKLVEFKAQTRLEEKRKKALDQHLNFIVGQTEKYSNWLTEGLNKTDGAQSVPASINSSRISSPVTRDKHSDDEFEPNQSSEDDEETIAKAEEEMKSNHKEEVELLKKESELPLEDLLKELPPNYLEERDKSLSPDLRVHEEGNPDGEFQADSNESSDDEDTIMEQEKREGNLDHRKELDDLKAENEMSVEELVAKYGSAGATPMEEDTDDEESGKESDKDDDDEAEEKSDSESDSGDETKDNDSQVQSDDETGVGLKSLLEDFSGDKSTKNNVDVSQSETHNEMDDVAALAESIQPKGNTLLTTSVVTKIPFLLKHSLREYQHIGLDWLVTMYERKLNGILADEMGLGKTIQTIALLAHLACEKGNWGPHLIIVPTSVMLNWEMECKKWCPGFKILTYYGTQKERKAKRTGWTKPNAFHICITSYKLVIQDHQSFRRKKWKYLILDEAQNIKNFKSQRWQLLLNFQTQRRLLLTGTPLQNNLMELWSLMHFLMPNVFQSHREFKEWFSNPVTGMIEGNSEYNEKIIRRLHKVLRPFLLRRLKSEVEKQLPKKYEHVMMCRLSKRQRFLYDDFMSRAKTKETLASGNLLSVINVLMQLRKVCNHPNLFEVRPTVSPFQMEGIEYVTSSLAWQALDYDPFRHIDLSCLNLRLVDLEVTLTAFVAHRVRKLHTPRKLIEEIDNQPPPPIRCPSGRIKINVRLSNQAKAPPITPHNSQTKLRNFTGILPNPKVGTSPLVKGGNNQASPGQGVTLKVASGQQLQGYSVQLVQHQGTVKAIPVGIPHPPASSAPSTPQRITMSSPNLRDGLPRLATQTVTVKQGDSLQRIAVPSFAQLVQTSTGRHLIITSNTQNTTTMSFPMVTSSGQRLTVLSPKLTNLSQVVTSVGGRPVMRVPPLNVTPPQMPIRGIMTRPKDTAKRPKDPPKSEFHLQELDAERSHRRITKLQTLSSINERRCAACPLYGEDLFTALRIDKPSAKCRWHNGWLQCTTKKLPRRRRDYFTTTEALAEAIKSTEQIVEELKEVFERFVVYVPAVNAPLPRFHVSHPPPHKLWAQKRLQNVLDRGLSNKVKILHPIARAMSTQFPDPRLIQYDCGKLQRLDRLLRQLKTGGHRVLIFTQMTRMLDVLEAFLNYHGHIYLRLDGATRVDQRQILMERFNNDKRIFCFILSTRSGGVGVNLTGADTVIFYDSDWNPTMDAQAQDRCHRIGQTRDVHIYRLVSEKTVEENILKKANQKRLLGDLAIEGGNFTTAYFKSSTIQDLFEVDTEGDASVRMAEVLEQHRERSREGLGEEKGAIGALESALAAAEEDLDVQAAKTAKAEAVADLAEFDENIPLEEGDREEPQISKAEMEVQNLVSQLTPVERYAMRFVELSEGAFSAAQLAAAERELEQQKREWELDRLRALREEEERRMRLADDDEKPITFSREDSQNQVNTPNNSKRLSNKRAIIPLRRSLRNRDSTSSTSSASSPESSSSSDDSDTSPESPQPILTERNKKRSSGRPRVSISHKNRLDLNSPRTRSRGDVKINLWTLDVSPILPPSKRPRLKIQKRKIEENDSDDFNDLSEKTDDPGNSLDNSECLMTESDNDIDDKSYNDRLMIKSFKSVKKKSETDSIKEKPEDSDVNPQESLINATEMMTSGNEEDKSSPSSQVEEESPQVEENHKSDNFRRSSRFKRQIHGKKINSIDDDNSVMSSVSPAPITRSMRSQMAKPQGQIVDLTREDTENLDVNVPTSPTCLNDANVDGEMVKGRGDVDVEGNDEGKTSDVEEMDVSKEKNVIEDSKEVKETKEINSQEISEIKESDVENSERSESSSSSEVKARPSGVLTRRSRLSEPSTLEDKKYRKGGKISGAPEVLEISESDINIIKTIVGTSSRITRSSANARVLDNGFLTPPTKRGGVKVGEGKKSDNSTFLAHRKRPDTPMPEDKGRSRAGDGIEFKQRVRPPRRSGEVREGEDGEVNGEEVNERPQRTAKVVAILSLDTHSRFGYSKRRQEDRRKDGDGFELGQGLMDDEDEGDGAEETERRGRKGLRRRDRELIRYPGIKSSEVQLVDIMDDEDLGLAGKRTRGPP